MGLDMMLYAREKDEKRDNAEEIGYWRKFNALHSYIVTEIGHNPDSNCEYIKLEEKHIDTLLEKLVKIKNLLEKDENKINIQTQEWPNGESSQTWDYIDAVTRAVSKILTPKSGFFWGDTNINSWYYDQVLHSIKVFIEAKKRAHAGQIVEYSSWW